MHRDSSETTGNWERRPYVPDELVLNISRDDAEFTSKMQEIAFENGTYLTGGALPPNESEPKWAEKMSLLHQNIGVYESEIEKFIESDPLNQLTLGRLGALSLEGIRAHRARRTILVCQYIFATEVKEEPAQTVKPAVY